MSSNNACSSNAGYWQNVHQDCMQGMVGTDMADRNAKCCQKINCVDAGSILTQCGPDLGKAPTMANLYADNNLIVNKRFVNSDGVGML